MFRRTEKSLRIESLEKRELMAADLLTTDRPGPVGTDDIAEVADLEVITNVDFVRRHAAVRVARDSPTAFGPLVDPFGVETKEQLSDVGAEPSLARQHQPFGVDQGMSGTFDQSNRPDPWGPHGEDSHGTRPIQPFGVEDGAHDTSIGQAAKLPGPGAVNGCFQETRPIKPDSVDVAFARYQAGHVRVDPMTHLEA